jgi:hypothetical protein
MKKGTRSCDFFGSIIGVMPQTKVVVKIKGLTVGSTVVTGEKDDLSYRLTVTGLYLDGTQVSFVANNQVVGSSNFVSDKEIKVNLIFLEANTIKG